MYKETEQYLQKLKIRGIHLQADIQTLRTGNNHVGTVTGNGFVPEGTIYKMWSPLKWTGNKAYFRYKHSTGKIRVHQKGLYLVYVQILFHDGASRLDFGVYINNNPQPYVTCLKYDVFRGQLDEPISDEHDPRYSVYSRCDVTAQIELDKNDKVYIKSLAENRTIIAKPHLTFWGMTKI